MPDGIKGIKVNSISISDTVLSIGANAFSNCSALTGIEIPDSVTSIGEGAFARDEQLTNIIIPDSVTSIGARAFMGCQMTEITLPEGLENIGERLFYCSFNLNTIIIPGSVTSIGDQAFYDCYNLTDVYFIGDTKTWNEIVIGADNNCLTNANIHYVDPPEPSVVASGTCGDNLTWELTDDGTLTISGIGTMGAYDYDSCPWYSYRESVERVVINQGLTNIGGYAFAECTNITSITIPDSVTNIEERTFFNCSNLTSINIPDSVTGIGNGAFMGCNNLSNVTIPSGVTSIGSQVFYGCDSLSAIDVASSNTNYCSVNGVLFDKSRTELIQYPGGKTDSGYSIPDSVTVIGAFAFFNCYNLTSINIPNSVTSIGEDAFASCTNLSNVSIPSSVTSIGFLAFDGCDNLSAIDVDSGNANYCSEDGVLFNMDRTKLIRYPKGKTDTIYSIPDSVTMIESDAFSYCEGLTSISIPNGVTCIRSYTFDCCSNLSSVTIPGSVTCIESLAFFNCISLIDVYYTGSSADWANIDINNEFNYNDCLLNATIHYSIAAQLATPELISATNVNGGVQVKWSAVADAEMYRVFRKVPDGNWTILANTLSTSYTDKTAASGTDYIYTVRCMSSDGKNYTSSYDADGLTVRYIATPELTSINCGNSGVQISWSTSAGAAQYRVFRRISGGTWTKLDDTKSCVYNDKTAEIGITYFYTVRCLSADGKEFTSGFDTAGLSIRCAATPTLSSAANVDGGVELSWVTVPGVMRYRIYRRTPGSGWKELGTSVSGNYIDKTPKSGTNYIYTVRCVTSDNKYCTSGYNATGLQVEYIGAPNGINATNIVGGVQIKWNSSAGAAQYRVFRKTTGGWTQIGTTTNTSFVDQRAEKGVTYSYTVRCLSADGKSYTSGYNSTGVTIQYIAAPWLTGINNVNGGITIQWDASAGAEKYRVFRKCAYSDSWVAIGTTTAISYTDRTVQSGTEYIYTVRCVSGDGRSYTSSFYPTGLVGRYLAVPSLTSATRVAPGQIQVNWQTVTGAAGYRIYRRVPGGSWMLLAELPSKAMSTYIDKTAQAGTTYIYTVRAYYQRSVSYYNTTGKSATA